MYKHIYFLTNFFFPISQLWSSAALHEIPSSAAIPFHISSRWFWYAFYNFFSITLFPNNRFLFQSIISINTSWLGSFEKFRDLSLCMSTAFQTKEKFIIFCGPFTWFRSRWCGWDRFRRLWLIQSHQKIPVRFWFLSWCWRG